jgi:hemolysin activation/secretion protein
MKKLARVICFMMVAMVVSFLSSSCKDNNTPQKIGSVENRSTEKTEATAASPEEQEQKQTEAPTVEIPLEKQQLIGVRTVTASIQPLQKIIRTTGKVEYDERKLTTINTKVEG